PAAAQVVVRDGEHVSAGDKITEGSISPQELLLVRGRDEVQNYLVREVQRVYRSQGVDINDKHIEVIVRQMMRKVKIENAGDTGLDYYQKLRDEAMRLYEEEEALAAAGGGIAGDGELAGFGASELEPELEPEPQPEPTA